MSYRVLDQMLGERGVSADHSTIYRWVQRYAPEIEKRLRWQWRGPRLTSWRVDETYVKVRGQWAYLCRAVDQLGNTIDFYLSPTRNTAAAKRFLGKVLNGLKDGERPSVINTDQAPAYAAALAKLKTEGKCPGETQHRQVKRSLQQSLWVPKRPHDSIEQEAVADPRCSLRVSRSVLSCPFYVVTPS